MAKKMVDSDKISFRVQTQVKELQRLVPPFNQPVRTASPVNEPHYSRQATSGIKFPKFDLPKFGGKYKDWTPFDDCFIAAVDTNHTLTDVQKLSYLKA